MFIPVTAPTSLSTSLTHIISRSRTFVVLLLQFGVVAGPITPRFLEFDCFLNLHL